MKKILPAIVAAALMFPALCFGQSTSDFGQPGSQWWRNAEGEAHNVGQDFIRTDNQLCRD